MSVRLPVLAAVALIVAAGFISLDSEVHPLDSKHFYATVILALAVVVQRASGVQAWLSRPRSARKERIEAAAQGTLINLCTSRTVTGELLELRVHVWEVPLWYRKLFPYKFRNFLRKMRTGSPDSTILTLRPTLGRTAALGLLKQAPSGVRFRKGEGLVGVCITNNDRGEYLALDTSSAPYCDALNAATEATWQNYGTAVTHNLSLADARKLSHSYGQVIGRVVQDVHSGEAIGCVTVSVKTCEANVFDFKTDSKFLESITALAQNVALELAA